MKRVRGLWRHFSKHTKPIYECRHCGTTVQPSMQACPQCGHDGIAEYELT